MKNGAVSYVTRNTAPFFYKAFATIKSIYSLYFNVSLQCQIFCRKAIFLILAIRLIRYSELYYYCRN